MTLTRNIIIALIIIGIISFGLKLYFVDFSVPAQRDNFDYTLRSYAHSNGDFSQSPKKMSGWPLLASPFFALVQSDNFLDYSNTLLLLSMSISTLTIVPMYYLARKFFDEKYSVVAAGLFAFEPHLNYNASFGFSEPLYILTIILSFYFIIHKKPFFSYLAFIFAGLAWWVRIEGIIIFISISIIFLVNSRKSIRGFAKYGLCVILFVIIIFPILIMRSEQYGDPLYFYYNEQLFTDNNFSEGISNDSINSKFILTGIYNIFSLIFKISFPYIIFLLPFGIIFSLRPIDQERKLVISTWIFVLTTLGLLIILLSIFAERRFLFFIYPFLIIFSVMTIQRLVEYGLSTFSWSENKKHGFLIGGMIFLILVSSLFILRFDKIDPLEETEKIEFAKFLVYDINGHIIGGTESYHMNFIKVNEPLGNIKNYTINITKEPHSGFPYTTGNILFPLKGDSINDMIFYAKNNDVKFIVVNEKNSKLGSLDEIYNSEENYLFLNKIFDSKEKGYTELKLKVFEIDYDNFHP